MSEKPNIFQWQDDGHQIAPRLGVLTDRLGNRYGQITLDVTCPPDSACHRWFENEASQQDFQCFVAQAVELDGAYEFIDTGMAGPPTLSSDWSSEFPVTILWRDLGEAGIAWRPKTEEAE